MARGRREAPSEAEFATMGDRLRRARTSRDLSLRTVAKRIGVSPSLISQVETGRAKPSVSTLYALATELGISLDELLFVDAKPLPPVPPTSAPALGAVEPVADPLPRDPVQRASSRARIGLGWGVEWERLTTESLRDVDFLFVTYEVGAASGPADAFQRHQGQEWGYVLSGSLQINIGFDEFVLGPGDAVTFDSAVPHRLSNPGDEPVKAIWFVQGRRSVRAPDAGEAARPEVRRG